jgi:hypothetical protein
MPASGKFLLDTNIILEGEEAVLSNLDIAPEVFVPAIALGELFFGAANSGRAVGEHCEGGTIRDRQGHCINRLRCSTRIRETETLPEEERAAASRERHLDWPPRRNVTGWYLLPEIAISKKSRICPLPIGLFIRDVLLNSVAQIPTMAQALFLLPIRTWEKPPTSPRCQTTCLSWQIPR